MTEFIRLFYPTLMCLIGLIIGSFLNVVIYRLPLMLYRDDAAAPVINLSWPASHCPRCKEKVAKRDNVPVLSWLLLRGRCRHCQTPISAQYPLIEALTGAAFLLIALAYVPEYSEVQLGLFALMFAILLSLSVIDFHHLLLPDPLVFLLLWSGLGASAMGYLSLPLADAVLGVIVSWSVLSALGWGYQKVRRVEGLGVATSNCSPPLLRGVACRPCRS
ncbi:prepilin peptidase [Ewingella americana]|uniref:prepilin peptidase n=1 Tax=Ewingella americana TaxID=41202 RepID=UPI001F325AB1|nr:prepilin peptidase [Ewingella americana]